MSTGGHMRQRYICEGDPIRVAKRDAIARRMWTRYQKSLRDVNQGGGAQDSEIVLTAAGSWTSNN